MAQDNPKTSDPKAKTIEVKAKGPGQKTAKQRLKERLTSAGVKDLEKMTLKQLQDKLKQIKSEGKEVPDLRQNNHAPESASRDAKIVETRVNHLMEETDVVITDTATGKVVRGKMSRLVAILDVLANKAIKLKDVAAAKEYFDRTLGKSPQEIKHSGEINTHEQRMPTKAELAAARAYELAMAEEEDDE